MRVVIVACAMLLLVASAAIAGTHVEKAEKQLQKRAVAAVSPPENRKSLCVCNQELLSGFVGRLEYTKQTVGSTFFSAQCHILAFDENSGVAQSGGSVCSPFTIVP
jgi:hypothetical protein